MKRGKELRVAAVIGLLLLCMVVASVGAESGPTQTIDVDGGSLLIDESEGLHCTASAGTFVESYTPDVTYHVVMQYEYRDFNEVIGHIAEFRLKGPDGTVVAQSVADIPLFNSNQKGTLSVNITPGGPGAYHWDIECGEGADSASTRGDLILR